MSLQYFSREFTKNHIRSKIKPSGCDVIVHYQKNTESTSVRMKIGKTNKLAMMTTNWTIVLKSTKWQETQVVMFWFKEELEKVHVYIDKIVPGALGL